MNGWRCFERRSPVTAEGLQAARPRPPQGQTSPGVGGGHHGECQWIQVRQSRQPAFLVGCFGFKIHHPGQAAGWDGFGLWGVHPTGAGAFGASPHTALRWEHAAVSFGLETLELAGARHFNSPARDASRPPFRRSGRPPPPRPARRVRSLSSSPAGREGSN